MTPDHEIATQPTVRQPVVGPGDKPTKYELPPPAGRLGEPPEPKDPLANITLSPRRFAAIIAGAGLLLGLILALVPVHVASLDDTTATSVSCGNTIGGVETPLLAADLGNAEPSVIATYVGTCQEAIGTRLLFAWPMFFAGMIGIVWLGVVRREPLPDKLPRVQNS